MLSQPARAAYWSRWWWMLTFIVGSLLLIHQGLQPKTTRWKVLCFHQELVDSIAKAPPSSASLLSDLSVIRPHVRVIFTQVRPTTPAGRGEVKWSGHVAYSRQFRQFFSFALLHQTSFTESQNKIWIEKKKTAIPPTPLKNPCIRLELSFNLYFNVLFSNT